MGLLSREGRLWTYLAPAEAGVRGLKLFELAPTRRGEWGAQLSGALHAVREGQTLIVSCERRSLRTALWWWRRPAKWLALPSSRALETRLVEARVQRLSRHLAWPSVGRPRVVAPQSERAAWHWAQRAGVLGGGGSSWLQRQLLGSMLFTPFTRQFASGLVTAVTRSTPRPGQGPPGSGAPGSQDDGAQQPVPETAATDAASQRELGQGGDLARVRRWMESEWSKWTTGRAVGAELTLVGRKPDRLTFLFFEAGSAEPSVAVKTARQESDRERLLRELDVLTRLHNLEGRRERACAPAPYGSRSFGGLFAIATQAWGGRRLTPPHPECPNALQQRTLRQYVDVVDTLSRELASLSTGEASDQVDRTAETARRFAAVCPAEVVPVACSFAEAVARSGLSLPLVWQHGDPSPGNIIVERERPALVDWEDAGPDYPPWWDLALVPFILTHGRAAHMKRPLDGEVVRLTLTEEGRTGRTLALELSARWPSAIPLGWGITLATMDVALRLVRSGRAGATHGMAMASALLTDERCRADASWATPSW